jgi:hypothetical protein
MQTDGHDEGNSRFSQFCEHAKKCTEPCQGNSAITVYVKLMCTWLMIEIRCMRGVRCGQFKK